MSTYRTPEPAGHDCLLCGQPQPPGHVAVTYPDGRRAGRVCSHHALIDLILYGQERFEVDVTYCLPETPPASYTCVFCQRKTYHHEDIRQRYCPCCGSADGLLPKGCAHTPPVTDAKT